MIKKFLLLCTFSLILFNQVTFATSAVSSSSLTNGTFNVREVLSLPGKDQPQKYFEAEDKAPIEALIIEIINYALAIMGSIAIILLIIAGLRMMAAGGESQQIDEAKEMIKYAIIGLIVAFLSYLIVIFVQSLFPAVPNA